MNIAARLPQPVIAGSLATRRPLVPRWSPWHSFRSESGIPAGPRDGLAAIPGVRPTSGQEASAWIKEAIADYYAPQNEGMRYRSEAAMSLRQMDDRFSFFKPDTVVLDLGCFPGGWSEVATERSFASSSTSKVIGVDMVKSDPLKHHTFIRGDVGEEETLEAIVAELGDRRADVVLSDLSPPMLGLKFEDHLGSMQCCLHAAKIMERTLRLGGWFVTKLLQGPEQQNWRTYLDSRFDIVRSTKPPASRRIHREYFIVCRGFQGRQDIAGEVPRAANDVIKHEGLDRWDIRRRLWQ